MSKKRKAIIYGKLGIIVLLVTLAVAVPVLAYTYSAQVQVIESNGNSFAAIVAIAYVFFLQNSPA
jgi:hypothetical protein